MNKISIPLLIFILLVIDLLAFTFILPLFPALIDYYGSNERRDQLYDAIEIFCRFFQNIIGTPSSKRFHTVFFGGVLGSLYSFLQFLSSPLLGALSDVYGRKPILLLSITGTLFSYVIWASTSNFACFLLSRIIGGLSKVSVSICIAMMADIYPQKKISQGMAIIGASFSVGFLIGPMIGAYFSYTATSNSSELTTKIPAIFAILLSIIELIFVAVILPETLDISKRKTLISDVLKNCLLYIKPNALFGFAAVSNCFGVEIMRSYGTAYFTFMFLYSGLEFTLSFLTHIRFNYNSMQQGKMYLFIGILMILVQGGIHRIQNTKQHTIATYGILFTIPAYIIIGYSSTISEFYAGLALYAIASSLVVPCMTSCVSNQATDDVKGVTIGVFRCLGALARAIGPLFASTVFWLLGPTVCYMIGGISLIIPVLMLRNLSSNMLTIKEE